MPMCTWVSWAMLAALRPAAATFLNNNSSICGAETATLGIGNLLQLSTHSTGRAMPAAFCHPQRALISLAGSTGMIAALCFSAVCIRSYSPEAKTHAHAHTHTDRDHVFDNMRFLLSVLIVWIHFVEFEDRSWEMNTWLKYDGFYWQRRLFKPIEARLVLLCFTFQSGVLSSGAPTWRRCRGLFVSVVMSQILYAGLVQAILQQVVVGGTFHFLDQDWFDRVVNAEPNVDWYLQDLVIWRLLSFAAYYAAGKSGTPLWPWLLSICAAVLVLSHYMSLPKIYSLTYAGCFLPSFICGILFPTRELLQLIPQSTTAICCGTALLVLWIVALGDWWGGTSSAFGEFFNSLPHKDVYDYLPNPDCKVEVTLIWCETLFSSLFGVLFCLCMTITICPRGETFFTRNGQNALYAYLLHPLIGLPVLRKLLSGILPLPVIENPLGHLAVMCLRFLLCGLVAFVLSSAP
eukprot:CAMPEP_0197690520 /NCGR_PEP_ID=MMETSP1338-20131121/108436_1 /TAXON_ID=43686 ORGANISM="Pelagodinium beii, Strain RCC1491" /NCGR_SAMPLE_ID=MMETSP1338 /ASSEMBLY_ACC=CAM_ASM_000754 /LENGTH=460 /DNA_ID=CAMNT_0043272975 /DNA_START=58 /DNA_END=1436 /DNA_ORIENTATION=+